MAQELLHIAFRESSIYVRKSSRTFLRWTMKSRMDSLGDGSRSSDRMIINAHEHFQSIEQVPKFLEAMNQNGVVRTLIVGSPEATILTGRTGFSGYAKYNLEVLTIAKSYPEEFIAFPTINPSDSEKTRRLEAYLEMGGQGLKLYSGHSSFHDLPLDHNGMLPVYELCQDRCVPILFHVNTGKYGDEFERVLTKFPRLKIICPHLCLSTMDTKRFEHFMDKYPRLHTDISLGVMPILKEVLTRFSQHPDKYRNLIVKYQDRIFFGTDIVITDAPFKTAAWIGAVIRTYRNLLELKSYKFFPFEDQELQGFHLDEDVLKKMYWTNFQRFVSKS